MSHAHINIYISIDRSIYLSMCSIYYLLPFHTNDHLIYLLVFLFPSPSQWKKRLPTPRPGQVLGLVGTNGIGKSTALKILAGKLKPNLGKFDVSTVLPCFFNQLLNLNPYLSSYLSSYPSNSVLD